MFASCFYQALDKKYDTLREKVLKVALIQKVGQEAWDAMSEEERHKMLLELKQRERRLRADGKMMMMMMMMTGMIMMMMVVMKQRERRLRADGKMMMMMIVMVMMTVVMMMMTVVMMMKHGEELTAFGYNNFSAPGKSSSEISEQLEIKVSSEGLKKLMGTGRTDYEEKRRQKQELRKKRISQGQDILREKIQ